MLSIPLADVLRIMMAARGDTGGIPGLPESRAPLAFDLTALLTRLGGAELVELLALAFLGSGQFTGAQWPEALAEARANPDPASHLATLPLLGDYLLEGLVELDYPPEQLAIEPRDV